MSIFRRKPRHTISSEIHSLCCILKGTAEPLICITFILGAVNSFQTALFCENMGKQVVFRDLTDNLGKYCMGGYGHIWVYMIE